MAKAKDPHYISNPQLYDAIVRWHESGKEKLSDEIGSMIMLLAKKLNNHRYFNRYPDIVKDEMQTEAIIAMVRAIPKFDHTKYNNPFAYLTTVSMNVMIGVVSKHYKNQATEISYFLNNTEVIDTADQGTLTKILQHDAYKESQERKKATKKLELAEKNRKPGLFDDIPINEQELVDDMMSSDDTTPED
jgi:hypothetical protein